MHPCPSPIRHPGAGRSPIRFWMAGRLEVVLTYWPTRASKRVLVDRADLGDQSPAERRENTPFKLLFSARQLAEIERSDNRAPLPDSPKSPVSTATRAEVEAVYKPMLRAALAMTPTRRGNPSSCERVSPMR
jgi:hypothetical protein